MNVLLAEPIWNRVSGVTSSGFSTLVTPNPNQIPSRFLYPGVKDFFAVYLRTAPGERGEPW